MLLSMSVIGWLFLPADMALSAEPPVASMPPNMVLATVAVGRAPSGVAVNPITNRIYVCNNKDKTVSVLDGNTRDVLATVKIGGNLSCVVVNSTTNRIYVGNVSDDTVCVIDGNTNSVIASVGMPYDPYSMAVNPVTNRIYISCGLATIYVIDENMNNVISEVNIDKITWGVAVNPITNCIYVAIEHQISIINGKTNTITATIESGCMRAELAVNAIDNRVYITDAEGTNNKVRVLDGRTKKIIATVRVGNRPQGIAVDPSTSQIYIANDMDNTISILDGTTDVISATVPLAVQRTACALAVNPVTQQVCVVNNNADTISILDGKSLLTPSERAYASTLGATYGTMFPPFEDNFSTGKLDLTRWTMLQFSKGPWETINIVGTDPTARRLCLHLGSNPHPDYYIFHGIYTQQPVIDFANTSPTEIDVDVDWSHVADGREAMAAGIIISPDYGVKDFIHDGDNYLQVMYRGNLLDPVRAHMEVSAKFSEELTAEGGHRGGTYNLYDEGHEAAEAALDTKDSKGYNDPAFAGRRIGLQHLRIIVSDAEFVVWENDKKVVATNFTKLEGYNGPVSWSIGYLYLLQSGVEDTPANDVYFGNVSVHKLREPTQQK
jgi:YVTN family beta-propeller protein